MEEKKMLIRLIFTGCISKTDLSAEVDMDQFSSKDQYNLINQTFFSLFIWLVSTLNMHSWLFVVSELSKWTRNTRSNHRWAKLSGWHPNTPHPPGVGKSTPPGKNSDVLLPPGQNYAVKTQFIRKNLGNFCLFSQKLAKKDIFGTSSTKKCAKSLFFFVAGLPPPRRRELVPPPQVLDPAPTYARNNSLF